MHNNVANESIVVFLRFSQHEPFVQLNSLVGEQYVVDYKADKIITKPMYTRE